jgi:hypothetical protein
MAKTELRLAAHGILPNVLVIELWYEGRLIGTVYGAEGPGFRLMTGGHPELAFAEAVADGVSEVRVAIGNLPAAPRRDP